jgi:hypothetical protein
VLRPVVWAAPWVKMLSTEATIVPRPIWIGLVPPRPVAELPAAPRRVCDSASWKVTCEAL